MRRVQTTVTILAAIVAIAFADAAYAAGPYCQPVAYAGRSRLGTYGTCYRCITGPYSNTSWTSCPLSKQPGQPADFAQCGANTVSISAMCDDSVGGSATGSGGTIRVTSATLGANCGVPSGNVTTKVGAICSGRDQCTLTGHDVGNPDPAPNCAKAFAVEWTCSGQGGTRSNANPATTNETTPLTLTCRAGSTGSSSMGGYTGGGNTSGTGRATAGSSGSSSIGGYTGGGNTSGTGRATAGSTGSGSISGYTGGGATGNNGVVPNTGAIIGNQSEERDRAGRLTKEAARVYILNCPTGRNRGNQIYIYQYLKRPGFRAVYPGDWGHAVGGRDFGTYNEAFSAACPW